MHADHPQGSQTLGAGGAHIVLAQHLQHGRTRLPGDHRQGYGAEHDSGQDEVRDGRGEGPFLPREQAVDEHEAGHRLEEEKERNATRYRGPAENAGKEDDEQKAPPEDRHGITDERAAHHGVIEDRPALHRGDDAGRDAERYGEDHGADRQFQSGREQGEELRGTPASGDQRLPQIAMQCAPSDSRNTAATWAGRNRTGASVRHGVRPRCPARPPSTAPGHRAGSG